MTAAESYQDELAALRGLLGQPAAGLHLLEFATMPQLEEIFAEIRPLCGGRGCLEIAYDPPREEPGQLLSQVQQAIANLPPGPPPLLLLHPAALPDAAQDGPAAIRFWKSLNFHREALGALPAQVLLCVDPWHHGYLVDQALDLLSWLMPRFHLIPPPDAAAPRQEMLTGTLIHGGLPGAALAAESRWETFWPQLEKLRSAGPLPPASIRTHVLPLLESALAAGNLVRARQVRDAVGNSPIAPEDLVPWHKLNALLASGAGDAPLAEIHAERLLDLLENTASPSQATKAANALWHVANVLLSSGLHTSAARFYKRLIPHFTTLHGAEHRDTLGCRGNLAAALDYQGKHAEAEVENRARIAIEERVLGPEHPDTLSSRNNLANVLDNQGKHAEAEAENRAVLAIQERVLSPEHPNILNSRNNLTASLHSQGKYAEAEAEYRAVLAIQERILGPEHPQTLGSRNNLASALESQGKHARAEAEHRAVLAIRERVLGPEHPNASLSCYNLSITLENLGRKDEALALARRALAGWNKVLGENHPDSQDAKRRVERLEKE